MVAMHDKEVLCIVWKRNVSYLKLGTTCNDGEWMERMITTFLIREWMENFLMMIYYYIMVKKFKGKKTDLRNK
jgi:hypothetical protein